MKKLLLALIVLGVPLTSAAQDSALTERQWDLLNFAWAEGARYDLGLAAAGVLMQETLAGEYGNGIGDLNNGFGQRSYGPMQVQLEAANDALKTCPHLDGHSTNEELLVRLLTDPYWNIQVGACYLKRQRDVGRLTWRQTLLAYNVGLGAVEEHSTRSHAYVLSVVHHVTDGLVGTHLERIKGNSGFCPVRRQMLNSSDRSREYEY